MQISDGEYVWVFKRPDKIETVQLPTPKVEVVLGEKMWWTVMVVLLQLFRAI